MVSKVCSRVTYIHLALKYMHMYSKTTFSTVATLLCSYHGMSSHLCNVYCIYTTAVLLCGGRVLGPSLATYAALYPCR